MEDIINQIKNFIIFELDPTVRILIVGIFLIFGLLTFRQVIKDYVNAKSYSSLKIASIIFTVLFIFIAVFVAAA